MEFENFVLGKMSLSSKEHGEIVCSPVKVNSVQKPNLFADPEGDVLSLQASGAFGSLLLQEIKFENYSIRSSHYSLKQETNLKVKGDAPSLGLHYTLKNNFRFTINGYPEAIVLKHQYNLIFVPTVHWDLVLRKGEHNYFAIQFTSEYLHRCTETIPLLAEFLEKADNNIPAIISMKHMSVTPDIMNIIHNILNCPYTKALKKMYVETKVQELLLLSLKNAPDDNYKPEVSLQPSDLEKLNEAREYIIQHMDNPASLKELARIVGINDFKLKKGFKELFGTTVFGLLHEERMQKAKTLLTQNVMSILEISTLTGYKNLSNFTAAFKKRFGYPPSAIRQSSPS